MREQLYRDDLRRSAKSFGFYLAGLAIIAGLYFSGGYFGLTQAASAALSFASAGEDRNEQTRLSIVTANAREIRAALAKPVAGLEPLGPIREKAANKLGGPKAIAQHAAPPKLSREARDAFASGDFGGSNFGSGYSASSATVAYDRHRVE